MDRYMRRTSLPSRLTIPMASCNNDAFRHRRCNVSLLGLLETGSTSDFEPPGNWLCTCKRAKDLRSTVFRVKDGN